MFQKYVEGTYEEVETKKKKSKGLYIYAGRSEGCRGEKHILFVSIY